MSVTAPATGLEHAARQPERRRRLARRLGVALGAAAVATGVALRFWATSDLWLDEALSVHIAGLPPGDIGDALRHDGHPPLYYFLLHGWMSVFGEGDGAVRALSGVLGVAALPLAWWAGRRYGGRVTAVAMLLLVASSPFAVRYGTEARMYSLVMLLVLAGWLLVQRALRDRSPVVLVGIGLVTGVLLLTHYWAFYLVAATGLVLLVAARRGEPARRRAAARVLVAMGVGSLLFLPWLPGFLHQLQHTGTPWSTPARPAAIVMDSLQDSGGGPQGEGRLLGWALGALALLGLLARHGDGWRVELDFRTVERARPEALVVAGTLAVAAAVGFVSGSGFATRYFAVVFPLFLLLAALGATRLPGPWVRSGVVGGLVVVGLAMSTHQALTPRTQGGEIARVIASEGAPGDVVAFCPDQLGPAVDRVLPERFVERPFPEGEDAARVDWVDYEDRNAAADPGKFARALTATAAGHDIWLVWRSGYRTFGDACARLAGALGDARPGQRVVAPSDVFEAAELVRFRPPG